MKWQYSISTNTLWTSFDYGEVEGDNYDEALVNAKKELKYNFDKANQVLQSADVTKDFSIEYNEDDIQLTQE